MKLDPDIHNFFEHLVVQHIHELELDDSRDDDFLADLCCLTLNQLPPHYIRYDVDMCSYLSDEERLKMDDDVAAAIDKALGFLSEDSHKREVKENGDVE
ncbi:late competence development ComFB family protein [Dongshaea marina]|uniref:late competence development ComFB family protein n=1 Tax=Dongshaea marina TaxID=2047966 RepID=UPI000D3E5526|nr:late competence development ComFB family protein [Dongshaea marina]